MKKNKVNKSYVLLRLWKYMYRYKWLLLIAFLFSVTSNVLAVYGPRLSGYAINAIELGVGKVQFDKVYYYVVLMLIFYAVSAILSFALSALMIKISRNVTYRMRKDVFDKLAALPVSFFDRHQTGDIISRISYDIDTINTSLSTDLIQIFVSFITIFGSLWMMISISPKLVLIFVVTIPASILFTRYRTGITRPLFKARSEKLGTMNGYIEEAVSAQKTTKAYNREEVMISRFDKYNNEAVEAYCQSDYMSCTIGPTMNFINNVSLSFISVFGALLYMNGSLLLGDISSFVLYSRKFTGPINEFANIVADLQSALAAAERVFRLLDEETEPADSETAVELVNVKGDVTLENVRFGYYPDKPIIKDLSLDIKSGSVVAIVGPTGAGKTTIINLLMRFYDVNSGSIKIDGIDIKDIKRSSLRKAFSMVLQETWLFNGTVFENIAYGKDELLNEEELVHLREEVKNAAKAAKIDDYIEALPHGYDTVLSENGVNISKGQKQLLTIARAMILDSKMLILDEATSNVDTATEQKIQAAMLRLMSGKTCFVIAHRLSTIRNADLILVVKDGNVIEQGTHDSLMKANGFYNELYNSQFAI